MATEQEKQAFRSAYNAAINSGSSQSDAKAAAHAAIGKTYTPQAASSNVAGTPSPAVPVAVTTRPGSTPSVKWQDHNYIQDQINQRNQKAYAESAKNADNSVFGSMLKDAVAADDKARKEAAKHDNSAGWEQRKDRANAPNLSEVEEAISAYRNAVDKESKVSGTKELVEKNNPGEAALLGSYFDDEISTAQRERNNLADILADYGIATNGSQVYADDFYKKYFDSFSDEAKASGASTEVDVGRFFGGNLNSLQGNANKSKLLSADEAQMYNYLAELDKANGTNRADIYRRYMDGVLNQRQGQLRADEILAMERGNGRGLLTGVEAVKAGASGSLNDLLATITGKVSQPTASEYTAEALRTDLTERGKNTLLFDAAQSVGGMAPGVAAGLIHPYLGAITFGATSGASGYQQKLAEGWSEQDAVAYGVLTGASEVALGKVFGGIPSLGGKVGGVFAKQLPKLDNAITRAIRSGLGEAVSEAREEAIQTYIEPAIVSLIKGVDFDAPDAEEVIYNAIIGAITSAGIGAPRTAIDIARGVADSMQNPLAPASPQNVDNAPQTSGNEITPPTARNAEQTASGELNSQELRNAGGNATISPNNNVMRAVEMAALNASPSEIFNATGLVRLGNGNLVEQSTGEVVWRADNGSKGNVEGNNAVQQAEGLSETGTVEDDGRGTVGIRGQEDGQNRATALTAEQRQRAAGEIAPFISSDPDSMADLFVEEYGSEEAFADVLIDAYLDGEIALEQWVDALGETVIDRVKSVVDNITRATDTTATTATSSAPPKTVPTQSRFLEQLFNEDERQIEGLTEEDFTHEQRHDAAVNAEADQRISTDGVAKVQTELNNKPADQWNDTDVVTAQKLLDSEVNEARNLDGEAAAKAYTEIAKLAKAYRESGTEQGRAMRQRRGFDNSVAGITALAAETLFGEGVNTRKKLKPQRKSEIMNQVADLATRYNNIAQGDVDGIINMIKEVNEIRGTTGLFSKATSKTMNWALEQAKTFPDGEQFLSEVLATQIKSIAGDYVAPSVSDSVKSYRFLSMLSKISTVARNLVSNGVLDGMEMFSNNITVPLDVFLSQFTGTRSTTVERGILSSEAKRKGTTEGMVRSMIQVGLDADLSDAPTKYDQRAGRNFKMTGNFLERFLSTWEKYENYALKTTDEAAKGGIAAEKQRGIDALLAAGKVQEGALSERAKNVALERTLQNDTRLSNFALKARDAANDLLHVGSVGAGDLLMPFAKIPANAVSMSAAYTPAGVVSSAAKLVDVLKAAKDGTLTADQQAEFVQSFGRALTGAGLTAVSTFLGVAGVIKAVDDEDKDKAAAEKSAGQSGVQINLDAFGRMLNGESADWKAGDKLLNVGFLQPINANLTMGLALADAYNSDEEITLKTAAEFNAEALAESILDFPAVSQIKNMADNFKYSDEEEILGKAKDAALGFAGDVAGSFVPNALRGIAAGTDPYIRDIYSGETTVEQTMDNIKAGIPDLRETLPVATDSWGNPKMQMAGPGLNFLNQNILPGAVNVYQPNAMMPELERLTEAGITGLYPDRSAPGKISDTELSYEDKQQYLKVANSLENKLYNEAVNSGFYKGLTDEQKGEWLRDIQSYAESAADTAFCESKGIKTDKPSDTEKLLQGVDKPGTSNDVPALKEENVLEYLLFSSQFSKLTGKGDYSGVDALLANLDRFDENTKDVINNKDFSNLGDLLAFKDAGSNAETYYTIKDSIGEKQWEMDVNSPTGSHVRMGGLANADIPVEEKDKLVNTGAFDLSKTGKATYEILRNYNLSPELASTFFDYADWTQNAGKEAESNGTLTAYETATALSKIPGLDNNTRSRIFNDFKAAFQTTGNDYGAWNKNNYTTALNRSTNYGRRVGNNEALEALLAAAGIK